MAGHSKWANIKHKKAVNDKKRSKVWGKLIREITVAARVGNTSDPTALPRLRLAVDKALAANMPKDTIEKACKRGAGELGDGTIYEEARYEGYGPGGIAVMVDCLTDNRNRTVSELRQVFTKIGGNLGTDGCVAYMFNKLGTLHYGPEVDEEKIIEAALEAGAEDVVNHVDGSLELLTAAEDYQNALDAMIAAGHEPLVAELTQRAKTLMGVDAATGEKIMHMVELLEDLDDVQNVYSNANLPDEILQAVAS